MKIRVFEAFAGYGSQSLAFERLKKNFPNFDYEVVGISEIDKYAIDAYNALHQGVTNYGDISKINWDDVPDFDLFTYSSPCQDFSSAGLQRGGQEGSGTRSSLLWECRRAIIAKKPKFLLLENVAALVSEKFLPLFNKWQAELESYGYSNFAQVLNAKDYGVPQNRERVFLVSILDDNARYHFPEPFKLEKRLKDVLEVNVDEKYYLSDKMIDYMNRTSSGGIKRGKGIRTEDDEICGTIMAEAQLKTGGGCALLKEEQCDIHIIEIKCVDYKAPNGGSGTGYSQYFIIEIKYSNGTIQQMELHTWYRPIEVIISDFLSGLNYCPDMKYQKADVSLLFIALSEKDATIWEHYKAFVEHSKERRIIG